MNWKRIAILSLAFNVLLLIGGGIFGNAYKKLSESEKLHATTSSAGVTIREPVLVGGKVVYKETFKTDTSTLTDSMKKKDETTKRNLVFAGVGVDQNKNPSGLVGGTLLGSAGIAGELTVSPIPFEIKGGHAWIFAGF